MIDFPASTFTWKALPREPDPYYKYAGGFVGTFGQVYHVRFNIESKREILLSISNSGTDRAPRELLWRASAEFPGGRVVASTPIDRS